MSQVNLSLSQVVSVGYSICQISLGLLVHPYQTMQSLVQEKVFVWMALLPSAILALVTMAWRYVIVPLVQVIFSCRESAFFGCEYLTFTSNWITFFMIYWQVMLVYLLFRFRLTWRGQI